MCKYCEEEWPMTPFVADVPGMDIEIQISSVTNGRGASKFYMTAYSNVTGEEAEFDVNFCPMCGRRLIDFENCNVYEVV